MAYYEIAGATNFKRKNFKQDSEALGTYVITISNQAKEKFVDGDEFEEVVELNDLLLKKAIEQKDNLRGWRIALNLNNGTTISVGKIIGVANQENENGTHTTIATALMSNGSYLVLTCVNDDGAITATLASVGLSGAGIEVLEISNTSGTLTDEQFELASTDNCIIKVGTQYYYKGFDSAVYLVYYASPRQTNNYGTIVEKVEITKATKGYVVGYDQLGGGVDYLAPEYSNTSTYAVGDLCVYENKLYECSTAIATAEDWDATHWTETTIAESILGMLNVGY